jgi:glycerol kinase
MAQDVADIVNVPVERPEMIETTALGGAMLAAVGAGLHPSLEAAAASMSGPAKRFKPAMDKQTRAQRLDGWKAALAAV